MAIELMLMNGTDILMIRPKGTADRADIKRISDLFALLETLPRGLLLDWCEFKKGSIETLLEAATLSNEWQPLKIAVLAPVSFEEKISLIVRRKSGAAEVQRFELDQKENARSWLISD